MSDKPKKEKKEKKPKKEKTPKMIQCPSCHEEIPKNAKVCPHCAAKLKKSILPLILAAVALLLVVAACVSIFVFHFPIEPPFGGKKVADTVLGAGMELSAEEEEAVQAILDECGMGKITDVQTLFSHGGFTSYAVEDKETNRYLDDDVVVVLSDEDKAVTSISCQDKDIYLSGHLIAPVTDFYLSTAQRDVYLSACLDAAKARLDVPETAVFPSKSNWTYTMDGNRVTVEAQVTCKNTSGQEVTRPFRVEFVDGSFSSFTFLDAAED